MRSIAQSLSSLKRPKLLVSTAKIALQKFKRETTLERIFGYDISDDPATVLETLYETESAINFQRKTGDATYSIARHISVLTALMHEAKALAELDNPLHERVGH